MERVTFHSDESGFCVLRVKARGQLDLVTTVGHAAMMSAGGGLRYRWCTPDMVLNKDVSTAFIGREV
jgi:hypothetical protein